MQPAWYTHPERPGELFWWDGYQWAGSAQPARPPSRSEHLLSAPISTLWPSADALNSPVTITNPWGTWLGSAASAKGSTSGTEYTRIVDPTNTVVLELTRPPQPNRIFGKYLVSCGHPNAVGVFQQSERWREGYHFGFDSEHQWWPLGTLVAQNMSRGTWTILDAQLRPVGFIRRQERVWNVQHFLQLPPWFVTLALAGGLIVVETTLRLRQQQAAATAAVISAS